LLKIILEKILPLYFLILSGYVFGKRKNYDLQYSLDIVFYLLAPILVFISFYKFHLENINIFSLVFANTFYIFLNLFLTYFMLKKLNIFNIQNENSHKGIALSIAFSNVAYLGLPLIYFLYGEQGFQIAVLNFLVISILHFSLGIYFLVGKTYELFKIPFIYAFALAYILKYFKIKLNPSIINFCELTGKSSLPLMLLNLGTRLSKITTEKVKEGFFISLLKIFINLIFALLVAKIFNLQGLIKKVFVIQNMLPSAILNYVFCEKYNKDPTLVASIIFFSTLLSIIYIPILIFLF